MKAVITIGLGIAIIVGLVCLGAYAMGILVFGWISFPFLVGPKMTADGPSLTVGLVAVGLLAISIHCGGAWWFGATLKRRNLRWKWQWTFSALSGLLTLFAAGISVVAVTHQTIWLTVDKRPMYKEVVSHSGPSRNQLRFIGYGLGHYHEIHDSFPPGGTYTSNGRMLHGWQTFLLQGMNYSDTIDYTQPWNAPANAPISRSVIPGYLNSEIEQFRDDDGFALTHYAANQRLIGPNRAIKIPEITNGTGNTIFAGEINSAFPPWARPGNWRDPATGLNAGPHTFGGPNGHRGTLFLMADGSVRDVDQDIDPEVLRSLATPRQRK